MKVIIAGSRTITDYTHVEHAVAWDTMNVTEIVSGAARGVDELGERLAKEHGWPVKRFPAEWSKHGRAAGPIRNRQMAEYADALVAVWDGKSAGTRNMLDEMARVNKPVFIYTPNGERR